MTLSEYKNNRIKALEAEVLRLNLETDRLSTFIYELLDDDCPKEYKDVVATEVFGLPTEESHEIRINYITKKQ